jgi:uncharacterized protein (TIGR03435 family)
MSAPEDHCFHDEWRIGLTIRALVLAALMIAASGLAVAQSTAKPAGFDVASVRPNLTGLNGGSISRSGGKLTIENTSLRECIAFAYSVATGRDYELSGPAWLDSAKFDIVAAFPSETSRDRVREMLQTLLAERFSLKTHRENRKLPSYALVVGKRGPKLPAASTAGDGAFIFGEDHVTFRAFSTSGLADRLSGPVFKLDRPVVDMTGIKGFYDFTLNWAPDDAPVDGRSGASIFTALQEQLGLKLEARKIVFKILVVDHANREPADN